MEKSFLSFVSTYPTWEPGAAAKQMLASLDPRHPLAPSPHYPFTSLYQNGGHMQSAAAAQGQLDCETSNLLHSCRYIISAHTY